MGEGLHGKIKIIAWHLLFYWCHLMRLLVRKDVIWDTKVFRMVFCMSINGGADRALVGIKSYPE